MFSYGVRDTSRCERRAAREIEGARGEIERLDELGAALTRGVLRRLSTYARHRTAALQAAEVGDLDALPTGVPAELTGELIGELIGCALDGPGAWDQADGDLAACLCAAYRQRVTPPGGPSRDSAVASSRRAELDAAQVAIAARVVDVLYDSAVSRRHGEVVQLLDSFRAGHEARADVATHLGIRVRRVAQPAEHGSAVPRPPVAARVVGAAALGC